MIRVGVVGAAGRMGQMVCHAVASDPDLSVVAGIDPSRQGDHLGQLIGHPDVDVRIAGDLDALRQAEAEVAVDFTQPNAVMDTIRWAVDHALNIVVGTTGITPDDLAEIAQKLQKGGARSNVFIAPNFAIGAVLMQRFAAEAARFFPAAEIIELHHEGKLDAPSGTAKSTAQRLAEARGEVWTGPGGETISGVRGGEADGIRIHSVRLPGLVAHQEVIFGGEGETLTIRHDSLQRTSFMPGVLMAVKAIAGRPGLTVGLDTLLGLDA